MRLEKHSDSHHIEKFVEDCFNEIGGLFGTFVKLNSVVNLNPRWCKNLVHSKGIVGANTIPCLIRQIQGYDHFDRYLKTGWDDDCEVRILISKQEIRVVIEILKIEIEATNQVTAEANLKAYQIEVHDL